MHPTAEQNAQHFVDTHCVDISANSIVIDFGAYDVNGCLRELFEPKFKYIGIDQAEGPNVDVVCSNRKTPFDNEYADIIISTSCFEHDACFWMTFLEMCRILKPGGLIYINAPSAGFYHGYPGDCWRFYPDSWKALVSWAEEHGYTMTIVESYTDPRGEWKDAVGVFKKMPSPAQ